MWLLCFSYCVRACGWEVLKSGERWGPALRDGGVADAVETRCSPTCVIIPNFVALGQTVWAHVGVSKIGGRWGTAPLECGRG